MHGGELLDADKRPPPTLRNGLSLERRRADLDERRMTASLVVERLDVVEEFHLRFAEAGKPIRQFSLQRREEALHDGIVVAIAASTHTARDALGVEDVLVVLAGVGTPLIGMMEEPRVRAASLERHLERPDRRTSPSAAGCGDRPTMCSSAQD